MPQVPHSDIVIKTISDTASHALWSWTNSLSPKADSAVHEQVNGHSSTENHRQAKLLECRTELRIQIPKGWKGYQVLKLDLQPPPKGKAVLFIGPGQASPCWGWESTAPLPQSPSFQPWLLPSTPEIPMR